MPARSNKHIKKFNQLVDVYDPDGVGTVETISTRDEAQLRERRAEIRTLKDHVEELTASEFFSDDERANIEATESLPAPREVAVSHREEMLTRLDEIAAALTEGMEEPTLDASDDLTL